MPIFVCRCHDDKYRYETTQTSFIFLFRHVPLLQNWCPFSCVSVKPAKKARLKKPNGILLGHIEFLSECSPTLSPSALFSKKRRKMESNLIV